jgi:hypothetical protein
MSTARLASAESTSLGPGTAVAERFLETADSLPSLSEPERGRLLGDLLARLPDLAAADGPSGLPRVVDCLLAAPPARAEWRAAVPYPGGASRTVPFVPEFARRALGLGYLHCPEAPEEDPLLNPNSPASIDRECSLGELSLARAVVAAEQERSGLLTLVVGRHLGYLAGRTGAPAHGWDWLRPLLEDSTTQCLLTAGLADPAADPAAGTLWRNLLPVYVYASQGPDWPNGPLGACCALGLVLTRPADRTWVLNLCERARDWPGWGDEAWWPTRHPGADLPALQALLTEQACRLLRVPDRKFWPPHYLRGLLGHDRPWPPLERFVVAAGAARPGG